MQKISQSEELHIGLLSAASPESPIVNNSNNNNNNDNNNNNSNNNKSKKHDQGKPGMSLIDKPQHERQKQWQGLDFDPSESASSIADILSVSSKRKKLLALNSWLTAFWIGLGTAVVGWLIDYFIDRIVELKYSYVIGSSTQSGHPKWIPMLLFCATNVILVAIASSFVTCIETVAAGSGIPEIKAELNGVKVPRVLQLKTLVVKATGVLFSVAGSMPIGKEGPMIHSGAILGSGISKTGIPGFRSCNQRFRNDVSQRDFVACGAAAGVSAAFGAPIGGVLFAIEEGASFWSNTLTWKSFLSAVTATYVLNLLISVSEPSRSGPFVGVLDNPGVVEFGLFGTYNVTPWTLQELPLFAILGAIMGLCGALFNQINSKLTQWRMRNIPITQPRRRWCESLVVALCVSLVGSIVPLLFSEGISCKNMELAGENPKVLGSLRTYFCPPGQFNQVGSLFFNQSESAILQLFHSPFDYDWYVLLCFFLCYYSLACWTYGLAIPSGLFVPSLTSGAAMGRFYGNIVRSIFPGLSPSGSYALMGAAGMLGGMARITISATVIIIESTQNVSYALPVALTIMVAKWVGDLFNHGLYDIHNHLRGIPYLEQDPADPCYSLTVQDILSQLPRAVTIPWKISVQNLVALLKSEPYSAFPIVEPESTTQSSLSPSSIPPPSLLMGLITRTRLCSLLKHRAFDASANDEAAPLAEGVKYVGSRIENASWNEDIYRQDYSEYPTVDDIRLSDGDMQKILDLTPYFCPCPHTLREVAPMSRAYNMFRMFGIRHLPIVDKHNRVLAVMTRKCLTDCGIEHSYEQYSCQEMSTRNHM